MPEASQLKWWAGLIASAALALTSAVALPQPYDKWLMGVAAVAGSIAAYGIVPQGTKKD